MLNICCMCRTLLQLALRKWCHLQIPNPTSPPLALTRKRRQSKGHQTLCHPDPPQYHHPKDRQTLCVDLPKPATLPSQAKKSLPSRGRLMRVFGKRPKESPLSGSRGTLLILMNQSPRKTQAPWKKCSQLLLQLINLDTWVPSYLVFSESLSTGKTWIVRRKTTNFHFQS